MRAFATTATSLLLLLLLLALCATPALCAGDCCQYFPPGTYLHYAPCHKGVDGCDHSTDGTVVRTLKTECETNSPTVCCLYTQGEPTHVTTSTSCCLAIGGAVVFPDDCNPSMSIPFAAKNKKLDKVELLVRDQD